MISCRIVASCASLALPIIVDALKAAGLEVTKSPVVFAPRAVVWGNVATNQQVIALRAVAGVLEVTTA